MLAGSTGQHIASAGRLGSGPSLGPLCKAEATLTEPLTNTAPADSLLQQLKALARELPGLVSDRVELLTLELQRAAQSLVQIVMLTVAIAILGVTVWFALWAALISLLVHGGLPLLAALLLTVAINALVNRGRGRPCARAAAAPATARHATPPDGVAQPRHGSPTR